MKALPLYHGARSFIACSPELWSLALFGIKKLLRDHLFPSLSNLSFFLKPAGSIQQSRNSTSFLRSIPVFHRCCFFRPTGARPRRVRL